MNNYINNFKELSLGQKREILLDEMMDLLKKIELLCKKRNITIEKLKSSSFVKDKSKLLDEDYYNLLFIYVVYLKEDLASLL